MKFFSKRNLIYAGIVVALIVAIFFSFRDGNGKQVAVAVRGDITQEVAATGKVKPSESVNLGFNSSGRVASVNTFIGDKVEKGKILATLELDGVSADLDKAKAALREEEIKLRDIKNTSPITYNDASKNLEAAIKGGFADADNAVRNKTDQFFKDIPNSPRFEVSITSGGFIHYFNVSNDAAIDINSSRKEVEDILNNWQKRNLTIDSSNLLSEANKAIADLNTISSFLDKVAVVVNSFVSSDYAYDTTISNYKTAISGARSDVSGAIAALVTAKDKFNAAPTLGENNQFEDVLIQELKVAQARANADSFSASLEKSMIKAPFSGVVTVQDAKVGGAVSAGSPLISVVGQDAMYVEANISEIHIGKIMVGNPAVITFDAFSGEEFRGEVSYIEPGDVIIDGVVNYKIRVSLSNLDSRIKNGLTTNIRIETGRKDAVITLPVYSVTKEGDKSFVNMVVGKNVEKVKVELGIVGSDGRVEIINGLNEGDLVEF